jgi:rhodanese-related sulfurtransferase
MVKRFLSWSIERRLAIVALVLGSIALLGGTPNHTSRVTVNLRNLAIDVEKEVDHVTVNELADWIIRGKMDYRLVDLRSDKEYEAYHIPNAEHVGVGELLDHDLRKNEKIILYSEGGIHSAQAWFLLKAQGYPGVYLLRGGLDEWKDNVLFPRIPEHATNGELAAFEKAKYVSRYFGGEPQSGGVVQEAKRTIAAPKLDGSGGAPKSGGKKKKKEGC